MFWYFWRSPTWWCKKSTLCSNYRLNSCTDDYQTYFSEPKSEFKNLCCKNQFLLRISCLFVTRAEFSNAKEILHPLAKVFLKQSVYPASYLHQGSMLKSFAKLIGGLRRVIWNQLQHIPSDSSLMDHPCHYGFIVEGNKFILNFKFWTYFKSLKT